MCTAIVYFIIVIRTAEMCTVMIVYNYICAAEMCTAILNHRYYTGFLYIYIKIQIKNSVIITQDRGLV